jgi:hypothetical protein
MVIDISPMVERIEARSEHIGRAEADVMRTAGLPRDLLEHPRNGQAAVPRGQRLVRLAEALGSSVAYLVGLDPDAGPPAELLAEDQGNLGLLAGDEEALLRAYRRLGQRHVVWG